MYHFYVVKSSLGRIGFGVAKDYLERNQQYCSHSGDIIIFPYVFGGSMNAAKTLESAIKREMADDRWMIDNWKTEWFSDNIDLDTFLQIVAEKIEERGFDLEIVEENYSFNA